MVRVEAFQDFGVLVKVMGVTRPARHWDVAGEFRRRLLLALAREGIGLPYSPRVDVPAWQGGLGVAAPPRGGPDSAPSSDTASPGNGGR